MMGVNLFGPSMATLQGIADSLASIADDIDAIRSNQLTPSPTKPDSYANHVPIVPTWQTTEYAVITGLLVTADTSDFYMLKISNDQSFRFGLTSMVPQYFNLTGPNRIPVAPGMTITVVQATAGGSAIINATCMYLSGPFVGQVT